MILFKDWFISLFSSLIFVVHPVHTEVVAYISGRADSLATLFMLLCFIFYIRAIRLKSLFNYFLMSFCFILSLLSRENSLILPVLIILYHITFKKKIRVGYFISLILLSFFYILLRFTLLRQYLPHLLIETTLFERLPGLFVAIGRYIKMLILPQDLHMEYTNRLFSFTNPQAILGFLFFAMTLIYAGLKKRNKSIFFGIMWFFIALLPQSNIYPLKTYMAEHWLYLSSIGYFLILSNIVGYLHNRKSLRLVADLIVIALLIFYTKLTIKQNEYWQDPISFYKRTLQYAPASPVLYNNFGNVYNEAGEYNKAIMQYKKAIELKPDYVSAYNNLGVAYCLLGEYKKALPLYEKAIEISPSYHFSYINFAIACNEQGNYRKAIELYNKAIKIRPDYAPSYFGLGDVYHNIKNFQKAIYYYEKAVEFDPTYIKAYYNLGVIYTDLKQYERAISQYKKILDIEPYHVKAYYNLAFVYYKLKKYNLAIKYYNKIEELGFRLPTALSKAINAYR